MPTSVRMLIAAYILNGKSKAEALDALIRFCESHISLEEFQRFLQEDLDH